MPAKPVARSAKAKTKASPPESTCTPLPNGARLVRALRIGGGVLLLAILAAVIWPQERFWGVHALNYLPLPLSLALVVTAVFLFSPWSVRLLDRARTAAGRVPQIPAAAIATAALALFYFRPVTAPLLGDGQLWLNELSTIARYQERNNTRAPFPEQMRRNLRKEPLEIMLHDAVFQWVRPYYPQTETGPEPRNAYDALKRQTREENKRRDAGQQTYRMLSSLAGALFVLLMVLFARRASEPAGRGLFYLLMLGSATLLLFFGYVENYAYAALALLACLFAGVQELRAQVRFPWKMWLLCALAVGFHYSNIILLPAALLATVIALTRATKPARVRALFLVFTMAGALLGLGAYLYLKAWDGWFTILPLTAAMSHDGYALLSWNHGLDLLNLLALTGWPALLIVAFARRLTAHAVTAFLGLAALCGLCFVATFNPNLGMAVDWDLLAVGLLPLGVCGAWLAATAISPEHRSAAGSAMAGCVLLLGLPYVFLNTTEPRLLRRYEDLLRLDPQRSAYGWEKLGSHYERRGDIDKMQRAYLEALAIEPNPRYNFKVADALLRRGSYDEAAPYAVAAARKVPLYAGIVAYIGVEAGKRGNTRRGRQLLETAAECNPADSLWRNLLKDMDAALADTTIKPPAR